VGRVYILAYGEVNINEVEVEIIAEFETAK